MFMYAAGAGHPHKAPSIRFLDEVARSRIDAAVDAEVLQEILHRYRAIGRWKDGRQVFDLARTIVPVVIPIDAEILTEARSLLDRYERPTARDALHAAVVRVTGARGICSYDRDLDGIEQVRRFEPGEPVPG